MNTLVQADAETVMQAVIKIVFIGMLIGVCLVYLMVPISWIEDNVKEWLSYRRVKAQHQAAIKANRLKRIEWLEKELDMYIEEGNKK